ncbi:DNA polymerase III subunit gamma/tau [Tepidicella xavieri]|uniref:DNA polymerase III subunit gamma/tau n=1 Tax=Tepidicella xavieri TaxID=360241 RepID=A0A4R6UHG2_9BURK|nr:DNA polymerase III subunit gamma/tau [Tepidicella xavieri]TDQ44673.1 DNA polymerase-3 subunit gamma/tau [Tepidicella xavieri]
MSYVVLARKYRPRNFAEMVGQEHVVQALTNALTTQRLHHAYLFTGTRGVGKTTVSRILAKSLNCTGPDGQGGITAAPCGVCDACRDIDSGRFVDYTELDAASNRGVDEVQTLLEQAVYKPVQGRFKVFMIDEVHMLTNTAFNAMLKTLEEPPEYLKFVLATTDPQKVPVTVLSRCLQFNLRPMAPDTVHEHLARVLQAEQVAADDGALRLLARAARGSMRDALSLTDQAIAFGGGQLQETVVRQMLGAVDRSHVQRLIEALAQGDGAAVVQTVDELRLQGQGAASALEEMVGVLQRMAVLQAVPAQQRQADPDDADCARLAGLLPPDQTHLLYSLCLQGRTELGLAPDEYAALTMVLLRLLAFQPEGAEKKTLKTPASASSEGAAPEDAEPSVSPAPRLAPTQAPPAPAVAPVSPVLPEPQGSAPAPEPVGSAPAATDAVPKGGRPNELGRSTGASDGEADLADFWHELVLELVAREAVSALVRELALQAVLVRRDDDVWTLRVAHPTLAQSGSRERLQAVLQAHGHAVRLEVEVGAVADSPARRLAAAAQARQRAAEETLLADPFVQAMMRDFGGKIVPGSIQAL